MPDPFEEAQAALRDLVSEFCTIRDEFERLKKAHEPPYVAYASWALPAAYQALKLVEERPEPFSEDEHGGIDAAYRQLGHHPEGEPKCTCERGADLDHWSRCDVHGPQDREGK